MTEQEEFEAIKDCMLTQGAKLLLEDIEKNKDASDTIRIMPLIDTKTGTVICSQSDQMMKQQGYVAALEWVLGNMRHYRDNQFEAQDESEFQEL